MRSRDCLTRTALGLMLLSSEAIAIEPGELAGPVRLVGRDDREILVRNYDERRATAFLFLSSRCAATERSIESINRLYQKYRLRDVLYVGVCANDVETAAELQTFAHQRGVIFSIDRDPEGVAARRLGAEATPEVCLIDREGRLVYRGGLDHEAGRAALESAIQQLLREKPIEAAAVTAGGTPIGRPGPHIERTDPYGAPSFASELIFERIAGAPAHHCSTITQAPSGDLLCVWYGGSYESADDQTLFLSRRERGQRRWTSPRRLLSDLSMPPGNAVIFVDGRSRLQIVWCRMESTRPIRRGGGWGRCRLFARTSDDDGESWSEDRMLLSDDDAAASEGVYGVPRNPPIRLANGNLVLPLEGGGGGLFLLSSDGGETWTRGGVAADGSQPTLAQRADGSLLTLMRNRPKTTLATSVDGGLTWSATERTNLSNPGSGISMVQLANKHLVLVFNNSPVDRTPLSIVRSTDEGRTWEQPLNLESNPGEYSYPCIIQSDDGQMHITHTFRRYAIKHVELNEDWLTKLSRPN